MSELPFMQLYVSDYLGDTRALSCEQHGAYLLLLMTMWNARGTLPDDDKVLARIVSLSVKKWRSIRPALMPYFDIVDGNLTNKRVTEGLRKSARQSESRASAGALGGAAKALKNKKAPLANAVANGVAKRQHLPEPYRKEGFASRDPTEGAVRVSRHVEPEVFAACIEATGERVPDFLDAKSFPLAIVAEARKRLAH